jgi:hypothetical protein
MNRRTFLQNSALAAGAFALPASPVRHTIFIVNGGGTRKKEYYETPSLCPNLARLAREGFVFEEDHCDSVSSHEQAFAELTAGLPDFRPLGGSPFDAISEVMTTERPRLLLFRDRSHDIGHENDSFGDYLNAVKNTDAGVGQVVRWLVSHPYFKTNTAIVIRPEFGRDDMVNPLGQLHHSEGFYYAHRVASIFWGPGIRPGSTQKLVNRTNFSERLSNLVS